MSDVVLFVALLFFSVSIVVILVLVSRWTLRSYVVSTEDSERLEVPLELSNIDLTPKSASNVSVAFKKSPISSLTPSKEQTTPIIPTKSPEHPSRIVADVPKKEKKVTEQPAAE